MTDVTDETAHHGYADACVPEAAQGSGWRIFFIVAGTMCGLPVFILSAHIFGSLGFRQGMLAVLLGTTISAMLGACSAWCGSQTRMGLAMLADRAFGAWGARIVKLVIGISLLGWFGVNIGVLGATAATALGQMSDWQIAPLLIGLPVCLAIAATTVRGASSLERIGALLVPATAAILVLSVCLVRGKLGSVWITSGSGGLGFGGAVSAVVGSYIVGILIQPDYGRFVRRPVHAALGTATALGVAYPLVMLGSSLASLSLGAPELVSAMIRLGFGIPALAILMMGAWIDSSACLYSSSLTFANQWPRISFPLIVGVIALIGAILVILGADTAFIPFLTGLGVALPPLASILILSGTLPSRSVKGMRWLAPSAWICGTGMGIVAMGPWITLSGLPALDSIIAGGIVYLTGWTFQARDSPPLGLADG
ncbi:cytosine permease [Sphingomonas sp. SORGH_AS870]|uniref:cytosine permease n=1 Tax=Sphingomonas sp. SORGH_AS_0870 TaxID=3041801 RepID=UPI00285D3C91|nr:cytosine permease [Sphingomonas sp. SORGH_AS_0870]MDR6146192.1 cytosine permease [Sphingomonas sp. SORGH_AS_0870]